MGKTASIIIAGSVRLLLLAMILMSAEAAATERFALVIGMQSYPDDRENKMQPLDRPLADASAIEELFKVQSYRVVKLLDATQRKLETGVRQFARELEAYASQHGDPAHVLIYYSGHGVVVDEDNYLLPIGRGYQRGVDVTEYGVKVSWLFNIIRATHNGIMTMVLDACRDHQSLYALKGYDESYRANLSAERAIIAYAATAGDYAYENHPLSPEGSDTLSIYTASLVEKLKQPQNWRRPVSALLGEINHQVAKQTRFRQEPTYTQGSVPVYCLLSCQDGSQDQANEQLARLQEENRLLREALQNQTVTPAEPQPVIQPLASRKGYEPEMVWVPAGSVGLGAETGWGFERPVHRITVSPFWISKYEVTFDEWDVCNAEGVCIEADDEGWGRGRRSVINVNPNDIETYIGWLNQKPVSAIGCPAKRNGNMQRGLAAGLGIGGAIPRATNGPITARTAKTNAVRERYLAGTAG